MKRYFDNKSRHAPRKIITPILLSIFGFLFLAGCGIGGFENDPEIPATSIAVSEGQELASDVNQNDSFATLPPPIVVEASHTPVLATDTPQATETPENSSTPEVTDVPVTETSTPIPPTNTAQPLQPTSPPPPPPTETPEPLPTPVPAKGTNGLVASHFALQDRSEYSPGGSVWFEFTVANDTGNEVPYNALGVMPKKDGVDRFEWYQQTYGGRNSTIKPGGLSWEDRIKLPETGNYTLRLVMCFDGFDNCLQGGGTWHTMSDEIEIQIN
jgi:hypothetical protein